MQAARTSLAQLHDGNDGSRTKPCRQRADADVKF